jgi:hypothetical protein
MGWLGLIVILFLGFDALGRVITAHGDKIATACIQVAK